MSNQEILEKAIQKAISTGWRVNDYSPRPSGSVHDIESGHADFSFKVGDEFTFYSSLFSHDFAKALWGEQEEFRQASPVHAHIGVSQPKWKWHLQWMVIADDPIKYLGEHLND